MSDDPGFATRGEAIVAALDDMEEGDTLTVHELCCLLGMTGTCSCDPEEWTY